jgi:hypothetical protein
MGAEPMRVSATLLESFRLFMQPEQEWMTEEALIASINGEFVTNPDIERGLALGRILADPAKFTVPGGYCYRGLTFDAATMAPALALIDRRGLFEVKTQKVYGDVVVVSKADHLLGVHLSEFKGTTGSFDFDKYFASAQWRFMADAFEAKLVTYRVFRLDDHENGVVEIRDIENFQVFPYPELTRDCEALVDQFVGYVRAKGLDDVLRLQQRKWSGAGVAALLG